MVNNKMNKVVYYNDYIRCYYDGRVERLDYRYKNPEWKLVENVVNMSNGYNRIRINNKMILRHRLISFCFLDLSNIDEVTRGVDVIDHTDGNKLNNSVENLRITNNQGNQQNQTKAKGCNWDNINKKWMASIGINGRKIHLGRYITEQEARQAYLTAKPLYHTLLT